MLFSYTLYDFYCKTAYFRALLLSTKTYVKIAWFALKSLVRKNVPVQVRSAAPSQYNPNRILVTSEWFGFILYLGDLTWFYHKIRLATKIASPLPFLYILKVALLYQMLKFFPPLLSLGVFETVNKYLLFFIYKSIS